MIIILVLYIFFIIKNGGIAGFYIIVYHSMYDYDIEAGVFDWPRVWSYPKVFQILMGKFIFAQIR